MGNSEDKYKEHKTIPCSPQLHTVLVSEQANSPQPVPAPVYSSPNTTFPPLPPLPPKESPNVVSDVPPLPTEDNPNDIVLLTHKPPPPPPEIPPCDEKLEQMNTSTSQVNYTRILE